MYRVAVGHSEGKCVGGDVPPPAQSAEAKVYFYFVKCMGAKTPQQKHL